MQLFRTFRASSPLAAAAHLPAKTSTKNTAEIIHHATFLYQLSHLPTEVEPSFSWPAPPLSPLPAPSSCPVAAFLPYLSSLVAALELAASRATPSLLPRATGTTPATKPPASSRPAPGLPPLTTKGSEVELSFSGPGPDLLPRASAPGPSCLRPPTKLSARALPPATTLRPATKLPVRAVPAPKPATNAPPPKIVGKIMVLEKKGKGNVEVKFPVPTRVQTVREQHIGDMMTAADAEMKAKAATAKREKSMKRDAVVKAMAENRAAYRARMEMEKE